MTTAPAVTAMLDWQAANKGKLHYSETASTRLSYATAADLLTPTDCSGNFARLHHHFAGIDIGTYTGNICSRGTLVTTSKSAARMGQGLLPGDGILFDWNGDGHWDHIAMYAGGGKIWNHGGPSYNDMGPDLWSLESNVDSAVHVMVRRYVAAPKAPATVPAPVTHAVAPWPFKTSVDCLGNRANPSNHVHGGDPRYDGAAIVAAVKAVQAALLKSLGKHGTPDGTWDNATDELLLEWRAKHDPTAKGIKTLGHGGYIKLTGGK